MLSSSSREIATGKLAEEEEPANKESCKKLEEDDEHVEDGEEAIKPDNGVMGDPEEDVADGEENKEEAAAAGDGGLTSSWMASPT